MMEWVICPVCGGKTRVKIRKDTELKHFPLFCPKCRKETLIDLKQGNIIYANPEVRKVLVAGIPATEIFTEGTLWFAITDTADTEQTVMFLDEKGEIIKTMYY